MTESEKGLFINTSIAPTTEIKTQIATPAEIKVNVIGTGPMGAAAKTYVHDQQFASQEWVIFHYLRKFPSVTIVDSAGTVVMGEVQYVDENNVILSFSHAFAGKAYLN